MRDPSKYGRLYWCVKTDLSPDGEIYVHADEMTVVDGALVLTSDKDGKPQGRLYIGAGHWKAAFAASAIDGHAIAVQHWKGEVLD